MKSIFIHSLAGGNNKIFDPSERDACNDPAIYLRDRLGRMGYFLTTADDNSLADCEWVLFYDAISVKISTGWKGLARNIKAKLLGRQPTRDLYNECIRRGMKDRLALFLWEASAVSPENWDSKLHRLFPVIFTWNDNLVDNRKFIKIHLPQTAQFPTVPKIPFENRKLLVNISRHKFSSHPRELYSARRASIKYFERNQLQNFDLYGVGWNRLGIFWGKLLPFARKGYPSYRGTVRNKWDILPNYRFSLCYENIRDEPGYVTEKIFDSMRANCVPIYWGAPDITKYVDNEAFIDRRKFKSDEDLGKYLVSVTEHEYERFQEAMNQYLHSERFANFLPPAFADTIISALHLVNVRKI